MSRPLVFLVTYYLMLVLSITTHLWATYRGWSEDGLLWAIGYLVMFIYAEFYWAYRSFIHNGLSVFTIACTISGLWWVLLILVRQRLMIWLAADEISDSENAA